MVVVDERAGHMLHMEPAEGRYPHCSSRDCCGLFHMSEGSLAKIEGILKQIGWQVIPNTIGGKCGALSTQKAPSPIKASLRTSWLWSKPPRAEPVLTWVGGQSIDNRGLFRAVDRQKQVCYTPLDM